MASELEVLVSAGALATTFPGDTGEPFIGPLFSDTLYIRRSDLGDLGGQFTDKRMDLNLNPQPSDYDQGYN